MNNQKLDSQKIRKFLDKLVDLWGYTFDYEIRICTGNFVCLVRDEVLYFSDICNDHYDDSLVRMRLIYTYLVYSRNHAVMRTAYCQGPSGLFRILSSLGKDSCQELGIEYIDQELLYQKEKELIDSFDFSKLAMGDVLFEKQKLNHHYTVVFVKDKVTIRDGEGDEITLEQADIENYYILKKDIASE